MPFCRTYIFVKINQLNLVLNCHTTYIFIEKNAVYCPVQIVARWHNCYKVLSLFLVQRSARSCWSFHPKHRKEYYIINLSLSPLASDSFPDSKGREVSLLNHDQEGCNLYTNCTPTTQPPPSGRAITLSPGGAQICLDYKLNFDKVLCAPHLHFAVLISGGCLPN